MQIITPAQCRAARALLNWSQPELAERCDVHVQTISNFEKEQGSPSKNTLEKIVATFLFSGLEFMKGDGVKRQEQEINSYSGEKGFIDFKRDVYETIKNGGDVFVSNVDEEAYVKWDGPELGSHLKRMRSIKNLNFRIIVSEKNILFPAKEYAQYRFIPEAEFEKISQYIYGNKTAFISFEKDNVTVFVINHFQITDYFKNRFLQLWEHAKPV